MYNGIGLATARGSGTNAYVQKNLSFTNKVKQRVEYKTEEDIKKLDATVNRPANQAILAHQRKRQIELKCLELRVKMEEQGYAEAEIDEKVASYRETLRLKAEEDARQKEMLFKFDENGRPNVKETHQMAEINQERSDKLKKALGISPSFVEGSSLDGDRRAKESIVKNEQQQQKYTIVANTPSPELPKQIASKVNVVEKRDDKQTEKSERKRNKSGEKNKEKRSEPDNEKPKKEIPKKYAYDDRKHKRSRSRSASKSRDRRDKYSKDYKRSGSSARYRSRSKRSRRDSESSRSSRERERGRRSQSSRSRSSSYSQSSVLSSSSSSSFSSSQSSHNSSSSYSSRGKSPTRSPPIRRRRGSPNFLEKRRITRRRI